MAKVYWVQKFMVWALDHCRRKSFQKLGWRQMAITVRSASRKKPVRQRIQGHLKPSFAQLQILKVVKLCWKSSLI